MSADTRPPALALRGIVKHFDGVPALRGASLDVARGTVHGLIGQNGAGKSTLIRILAGIDTADAGTIAIDGATQALAHRAPPEGIAFIHQERLLPATFTVAEALQFGNEPAYGAGPLGLLAARRMRRDASDALHAHFGLDLPPNRLIAELSVAERQIVQITRALMRDPRILVLDEPTAALVSSEVDRLLQTLDRLRRRGEDAVQRLIAALDVRAPGPDAPVRQLSGGNQQKVALAKWLSRGAERTSPVYLFDEPTVGVDIGAKAEIYRLLDRLARDGAAILLFSSDLIELLDVTDRVLVMARGRIVRDVATRDATRHDLLAWATGARGHTPRQEVAA